MIARIFCASLASMLLATSVGAQDDKQDAGPWFDMQNCEVCKSYASVEGMMQKVKWECHLIDHGMMAVTYVPADLKQAMAQAEEQMAQTLTRLESGKEMPLCGFCMSFGKLKQAGAKIREFDTAVGKIQLVTSEDENLVKEIHAHAKRTIAENRKLQEMMQKMKRQEMKKTPPGEDK